MLGEIAGNFILDKKVQMFKISKDDGLTTIVFLSQARSLKKWEVLVRMFRTSHISFGFEFLCRYCNHFHPIQALIIPQLVSRLFIVFMRLLSGLTLHTIEPGKKMCRSIRLVQPAATSQKISIITIAQFYQEGWT